MYSDGLLKLPIFTIQKIFKILLTVYSLSPHIHPLKTKVKKPKTKGTKADSVEKVTVAELLPSLENTVLNKN